MKIKKKDIGLFKYKKIVNKQEKLCQKLKLTN